MSTLLIHLIVLIVGYILGFFYGCKLMGTSVPTDPAPETESESDPNEPPDSPQPIKPEPRPSVFHRKDLPLFLPGQGRLTEEQLKLRAACGLDPDSKTEILTNEEIDSTVRRINRRLRRGMGVPPISQTPQASTTTQAPAEQPFRPIWRLRIRKPGQRSRFYQYHAEDLALAAYHAAPNRNYPIGTEVELLPPPK